MLSPAASLVGETYPLNDLEEYYTQEAVDLGTFLVCASHLRLHPFSESARCLERASDDQDSGEEQPEMSMIRRERV